MSKNTKNINIEISVECWKKLKIISINKDISLQDVVKNILDQYVNSKKNKIEIPIIETEE